MGSHSPRMATHTARNQHQLGDFFFSSDLAKLRLGKSGNKGRINMNKLSSGISSLEISSGCSNVTGTEGITNLNYVKNKNMAKKERRKEQVDNAKFHGNGKSSRSASKSPKSKTRKELKQKENTRNEETKVVAMDLEEDTEEDKRKSLNLQAEIEKEQEYQNQMNMIYNSPSYFDHYSNDLEYQAEFHHPSQFLLDPQIMLQNPPMYFIAVAQPYSESPLDLVYFPSVENSSHSSSSGWSTPSSYSETSEDESSQDHQNYNEDHEDHVPLELDEELNNLVLSIIAD